MAAPLPPGFELDQAPSQNTAGLPHGFELEHDQSLPEGFEPEDESQYETPGQQALAAVEGGFRGATAGLSDVAAQGARDVASKIGVPDKYLDMVAPSSHDLEMRQKLNPIASNVSQYGTMAASIFGGTGIPGAIGDIAKVIPEGASFGSRLGSAFLRSAIEGGLIQGGDELSKSMLGQGDQQAPVAGALWNMGASSLLSGGLGTIFGGASAGLKKIADSKIGSEAAQFIEDFGSRLKSRSENPDLIGSVFKEISDFWNSTKELASDTWRPGGLKEQAVQSLLPKEANEQILQHAIDTTGSAKNVADKMLEDEVPKAARGKFQSSIDRYTEATNAARTPMDYWKATNNLKKEIGEYVPWKQLEHLSPADPKYAFVQNMRDFYGTLKNGLEDTGTWGKAGELQKGLNAAFKRFEPSQKAFGTFTSDYPAGALDMHPDGGELVDPNKIKTYVNTTGKSGGAIGNELRPAKMKSFVEAAENHRNEINKLFDHLDVPSPVQPSSLNAVKSTYGQATDGAHAADQLFDVGIKNFGTKIAVNTTGAVLGGEEGYRHGGVLGGVGGFIGGAIAPKALGLAGNMIGKKVALPVVLKVLSSGGTDTVRGLGRALDYAGHAESGAQKITKGIESLFKAGSIVSKAPAALAKEREKLREFIESGEQNQQVQEGLQQSQPAPTPAYAHGGEVKIPEAAPPIISKSNPIANHYPEQDIMLQAAKGRINNYLNQIRPQSSASKLPFDHEKPDKQKKRDYDKALDLANDPSIILNEVKKGTITPEMMKHFTSMYPELHDHLSKKITERITKAQVDGEKPSYKIRQGLGLLLGAHLDSTMTPQSIMAAQATYQKAPPQQPQDGKQKKNKSSLNKMPQEYQTSNDARQLRQQKT